MKDSDFKDAMVNSYDLIMGFKTLDDLLEEFPETLFLYFDPDNYERETIIEELIDYFENEEEYERCANLKNLDVV